MTRWLWMMVVVLVLQACASTPESSFYTLSGTEVRTASETFPLPLALGPVDLPEYLDRPQLVTRSGSNRLSVDEFNRWGGSLAEEIERVLIGQLTANLGTQQVYRYPSRVAADAAYRIVIDVRRFDGQLDGDVKLSVAWSVIDERNGAVVATRQADFHARSAGADYDAYTAALSNALTLFGDELTRQIATLEPAGG